MTASIVKMLASERRQILNALYIFIKIVLLPICRSTLICMITSKFVSKPPDMHDGLTRCRIRIRTCRSHRTYRNTSLWYPQQTWIGSGISMAHCSRIRPISCILIWLSLYDACISDRPKLGIPTRARLSTETRSGRATKPPRVSIDRILCTSW